MYGLPKTVLQIHYPNGVPTAKNSDWALETSLDVEWAHAIAPGATIHLVVSPDNNNDNLLSAVDYAASLGVKQVSMSWGCSEFSSQSSLDSHFNVPGVSFFASSGDNGAGVMWPAVSPYVIAVGGTTLWFNIFGCAYAERAWSGSGGGTSKYTSIPGYQAPFQTTTKRMIPDVSYNADPWTGYAVYMTNASILGGWTVVGGTSAGAPQWAALMALVNSSRGSALAQSPSIIYQLGDAKIRTLYFRDITSGNNGGYNAGVGYDEVTGLGTPLCSKLIPMLVSK
jgi:subtilase family serine protease